MQTDFLLFNAKYTIFWLNKGVRVYSVCLCLLHLRTQLARASLDVSVQTRASSKILAPNPLGQAESAENF